jgi:hypothetical protein
MPSVAHKLFPIRTPADKDVDPVDQCVTLCPVDGEGSSRCQRRLNGVIRSALR